MFGFGSNRNRVPPGLRGSGGSREGGGNRKPPRSGGWSSSGGSFDDQPQFDTRWGHCLVCNKEQWVDLKYYRDGTTYMTGQTCGHKDHFELTDPSYGKTERGKQADQPTRGYNERNPNMDQDFGGSGYSQGRDPLKGKKRFSQEIGFCNRCNDQRMLSLAEELDTGVKHYTCTECGHHWKSR